MINKSLPLQTSSRFDAQLITMGDWSVEEREFFEVWLDQISLDDRNKQAGRVITHFVTEILGKDLSHEGKGKLNHLQNIVSSLEQLVSATRVITNKFYRDHLNHMIKVGLLANAIANCIQIFSSEEDMDYLMLSSFLHDVTYPLSNSVKIHKATIEALKNTYFSAEYYYNEFIRKSVIDSSLLSDCLNIDVKKIDEMIEDMNHGIFSAIEFMKYLNNEDLFKKYSKVIRSIAMHDSAFSNEVDIKKDPILAILILADELQDWGRPSIVTDFIIPRINNFNLYDRNLSGAYQEYKDRKYSLLKQISGKMNNLKRLVIDNNVININIRFVLSKFLNVDINQFNLFITQLFELVEDDYLLNPEYNVAFSNYSEYEKKLYGLSVNIDNKKLIYDLIKNEKLLYKSPLNEYNFYINNNENELVCSDTDLTNMTEILLNNNNDNILSLQICEIDKCIKMSLKNYDDYNTKNIFEYLIYEMRIINYMIYLITNTFNKLPSEAIKIEGLCYYNILNKLSNIINNSNIIDKYNNLKMPSLINCIKNQSYFMITKGGK